MMLNERNGSPPHLHSFPTRRSSDLEIFGVAVHIVEVAVARDPERKVTHDLHPREQRLQVQGDHIFERHVSLADRSEEHTSELQSQFHLVCRLLLEKKKCSKIAK